MDNWLENTARVAGHVATSRESIGPRRADQCHVSLLGFLHHTGYQYLLILGIIVE